MRNDMVRSFKPKSKLLARFIHGFSTFEKGCDLNINFAAFPHVGPGLALYENARLEMKERHLNIIPTPNKHYNTVVLGRYMVPVFITYNGYVNEISVNFTPLGINYFFDDDYSTIAPKNFQHLPGRTWMDFAAKLFSLDDINAQLELFEDFLATQFRPRPLDRLQRSIDLFMAGDSECRISQAAEMSGMNERTFRRNFNRFMGCSPVIFKRIVRFRKAIDLTRMNGQFNSLTRLGQESLFYDSAHFAREYKLFTGMNPKSFFSSVAFLGNSEYPYIFF